jgi:serine/threonine protein phosphatase PrpC
MTNLSLRFAARSEIGKVRRNNEDAGYAATDLLVVADGMGGHEAGELASAATVAAVVAAASNSVGADEVLNQLAEAVITSGEYIADVVSGDRDLAGMGTTMTVVALREDRIAMAHVGDSRAYVYRDGALQQMTKDHTFVQTLVDSGEITLEQAAVHPRRNLMMRAIDGIHAVEVDLSVRETREGDRYLLCSDGLCGVIDANAISECLSQEDLTQAVTLLIDAAMAAGAPDNITVVVADVVNDSLEVDAVLIGSAADSVNQSRLPAVDFPEEGEASVQIIDSVLLEARKSWLVPVLSTIGVIALGFVVTIWWLANQWFVGVYEKTSVVAIFQGVPAGGMYRLVEISDIDAASLPEFERDQVYQTFESGDFENAEAAVKRLKLSADLCVLTPSTPGCPELVP